MNMSTAVEIELQSMLTISFIGSKQFHFQTNILSTGVEKGTLLSLLFDKWAIKDRDSAIDMIDYMMNEGERSTFNIIMPHFIAVKDKEERQKRLTKYYTGIDLLVKYSNNISDCLPLLNTRKETRIEKNDFSKGSLGWDMDLLICLSRMSFDVGFISEEEALEYINTAYQLCLEDFSNLIEIRKSYLIGEAMWNGLCSNFEESIKIYLLELSTSSYPLHN